MRYKSLIVVAVLGFAGAVQASEFVSRWPAKAERVWLGPEYWANRLQDWRIVNGRAECTFGGPDRNVHLLTREIAKKKGDLRMSVRLGRIGDGEKKLAKGWVGFRIAAGEFDDYRDSVIRGVGLNAGITTGGELFIGDFNKPTADDAKPIAIADIELTLTVEPDGDNYMATITARQADDGKELKVLKSQISAKRVHGNPVLVCHGVGDNQGNGSNVHFWFRDWKVSGSKVEAHDERAFGPILFAQHTLSKGVLKMTAQMPPIGKDDSQVVNLQAQLVEGGVWTTVAAARIDELSRTASFRMGNWDASRDTPYRLAYLLTDTEAKGRYHFWGGTICKEPIDKKKIVVAGFTGNNDPGFPNNDIVKHVTTHDPDVLVFTGDQIYERVAGYGVQTSPVDKAALDYLRKWYLWGWSFGDLARDRPCVCLPDDHDVYHGNLWGAGGRAAKGTGMEGQDSGGYKMPAEWVRMVERTQTSHLPDAYDPTPIEQGIGVYYTAMNYGGVSFAIIEDRKFKSAPAELLPEGQVVNGWFQNADFDPATQADAPGAILLGERQLKFLREWSADWRDGVWMKTVLSQTIFANLATLPAPAQSDNVVPKLEIPRPGEYPDGDIRAADADSNGWPQTPRNNALREIRRAFAFHLAGDQHLGSTIQYGLDDFNDAGFAFCVPSVANIWPRRWFPPEPGGNRQPGSPKYTGEFRDGFGNYMTVHAVSNPVITGREPATLHDRATGYGIVRFDRDDRSITIECWPRYADPGDAKTGGQYPGWPITIQQTDNYGRKAAGYLPTFEVSGMTDPVVQVIDESDGQIVYTLRIKGTQFCPKVFKPGKYTVMIGEQGTPRFKRLQNLQSAEDNAEKVKVQF